MDSSQTIRTIINLLWHKNISLLHAELQEDYSGNRSEIIYYPKFFVRISMNLRELPCSIVHIGDKQKPYDTPGSNNFVYYGELNFYHSYEELLTAITRTDKND